MPPTTGLLEALVLHAGNAVPLTMGGHDGWGKPRGGERHQFARNLALCLAVVLLVAFLGCVQDFVGSPKQPFGAAPVASVLIFPPSATITVIGPAMNLRGVYRDVDGTEVPGEPIRWESLNPAIATVEPVSGLVTAYQSGQVVVAATATGAGAGLTGYALLTIAPAGARPIRDLTPLPSGTGEQLNAMWGSDSTDVYAAGLNGTLLHFNGAGWTRVPVPTQEHLYGMWGTADSNVFAVGDHGVILHHGYDGLGWVAEASQVSVSLSGVWGSSPVDVYAVGAAGTILHYDGSTWSTIASPTQLGLRAVWGTSSSNVFAVGDAGVILHYDGRRWTPLSGGAGSILLSVWGTSPGDVYAVGAGGTVLHYDGTAWSRIVVGTSEVLYAVWGTSSSEVFVVGAGSVRQYDGVAWDSLPRVGGTTRAVWGSLSGDLFLVGDSGAVLNGVRGGSETLVFARVPTSVAAGVPLDVEVWVVDRHGRLVPNAVFTVSLAIGAGPDSGVLLGTTTAQADTGVVTFDAARIEVAGGYSLLATAPGLLSAESPSIIVAPAAPGRFRFLRTPSTAVAGEAFTPPVQVAVEDSFGNRVLHPSIYVGIGLLPIGITLTGINEQPSVNGVATFGDLNIEHAAAGYRLAMGIPGVAGDTSAPFNVAPGPATQITVSPEGATVAAPGGTQTFTVSSVVDRFGNRIAAGPPTWTSLKPAVATVDPASGVVTAVGSGQSTIAAQLEGDTVKGYALVTVTVPGQSAVTVWDSLASGTSRPLFGVSGTSATNVFAVGDNGLILHFDGTGWTRMTSGTTAALMGVWAVSPTEAFAVGSEADTAVLLRGRGGAWQQMSTGQPGRFRPARSMFAVWGSSPVDVFAAGNPDQFACTCSQTGLMYFGGLAWNSIGLVAGPSLRGVWGASRTVVFAVGGVALRRIPGGWATYPEEVEDFGVWGTAPNDIFAIWEYPSSGEGGVDRFDGTSWAELLRVAGLQPRAVGGTSAADIYLVGLGGVIYRYDGIAWISQPSPTTQNLNGIWIAPTGEVFIVGSHGLILRGRR